MHTSRLATRQRGNDTSPLDTMSMTTASSLRPSGKECRKNEMDALTYIWHVYFYHINRALDMPMKLKRWAINIAHPNLLKNLLFVLTPDITDPCST